MILEASTNHKSDWLTFYYHYYYYWITQSRDTYILSVEINSKEKRDEYSIYEIYNIANKDDSWVSYILSSHLTKIAK